MIPNREPNLTCGVLKLWINSRQFSDSLDYWDGNWLNAVAHCASEGASVTIGGSFIHLGEIAIFQNELINLDKTLKGKAKLPTIEPNLSLLLECDNMGHVHGECTITPDHMTQNHSFEFEIDQSYLKHFIKQCGEILSEYPIKDTEKKK